MNVNPVFATVIFSDGFESGDFSAWTGTVNTPSVTTNQPHTGTYSQENSGHNNYAYKTFTTTDPVFVRFYVRLNGAIPNNYDVVMAGLQTGASWDIWNLRIEETGWVEKLRLIIDELGTNYYWTNTFSADTWYCFEVEYDQAEGAVRVWVDGTLRIEQTGLSLTRDPAKVLVGWLYSATPPAITVWHDCVVVADTYIGPEAEGQAYVADLSQSISSTWNLVAQTNFRIIQTQSVITTWNTLTKWDAISDLIQVITTSWIIDVVLTLGGINYIVDLSQTLATTWAIITQWAAQISLSQNISISWATILQSTFNIVPSLNLATTWLIDLVQANLYIVELSLGINFSWAIDIVYTIGEAATGIGIAFLALILALTAIAIGLLYSKR